MIENLSVVGSFTILTWRGLLLVICQVDESLLQQVTVDTAKYHVSTYEANDACHLWERPGWGLAILGSCTERVDDVSEVRVLSPVS